MKRMIIASENNDLEQEANRVYDTLSKHLETGDMSYVDETEAYEITFDKDAEDLTYVVDDLNKLGYKMTSQNDEEIHFASKSFRAWLYEPDEEDGTTLYITR